ncbi:Poly [ADP-ribose] polymerase [Entamoeba marina]
MATLNDLSFTFDYSKTDRGSCKNCGKILKKDKLKVGREVKSRFHDGIELQWLHLECVDGFKRCDFSGTKLSTTHGWQRLRWKDFEKVRKEMNDDLPSLTKEQEERLKTINKNFWEARDKLSLMELFLMEKKIDNDQVLDVVADALTLGKIDNCPECKTAKVVFNLRGFKCNGFLSEFSRCDYSSDDIDALKRYKFNIPEDIIKTDKKNVLKNWEFPEGYPTDESVASNAMEEVEETKQDDTPEDTIPKGKRTFCTITDLQDFVKEHGGTIVKNVTEASCCISDAKDVENAKSATIRDAIELLTILDVSWLDEIVKHEDGFMDLRTKEGAKKYIVEGAEWRKDIVKEKYHAAKIIKNDFKPTDDSDIMKPSYNLGWDRKIVTVNDENYGWTTYNVKLTKTDIDTGSNSIYSMQIGELQNKKNRNDKFMMLFEWGRIGQTMHSTESYSKTLDQLLPAWEEKFYDCTGNRWENRCEFTKVSGRYYMALLDDGRPKVSDPKVLKEIEEKKAQRKKELEERASGSDLDPRVSELIKMIFDKDMMRQTLSNAGLNVHDMPIGKIREEQVKDAMKILSQISDVLSPKCEMDEKSKSRKIKELSTKYYTYVPHVFRGSIVLIDNEELLNKELKLVETMCDVEEAMKLIDETDDDLDTILETFAHYQQLKTKISPLDKSSERYKLLNTFFTNNQEKGGWRGVTKIVDIFEIEREGERERFKPHSDDSNRQLLYHGSRLTNFVGILSTGLRIAPPEAPCNGYRYGKGLYFADCASKSVGYCTYNGAQRGCMLFCEVALGEQFKTERDIYMEKPQKGTNSTYALGHVQPDPEETITIDDGLKVAVGPIVDSEYQRSYNSHSEFIVYEVPRVTIRYMVIFQC